MPGNTHLIFHVATTLALLPIVACGDSSDSRATRSTSREVERADQPQEFQVKVGKDVDLGRQSRKGKGSTADAGITLEDSEAVSFDSRGNIATKTAGFWKGLPGKLYTVEFVEVESGNTIIVEIQGAVRWDTAGRITQVSDDFLPSSIKTMKFSDKWYEISSFRVENGHLLITSVNQEAFVLSEFSPEFRGQARRTN